MQHPHSFSLFRSLLITLIGRAILHSLRNMRKTARNFAPCPSVRSAMSPSLALWHKTTVTSTDVVGGMPSPLPDTFC